MYRYSSKSETKQDDRGVYKTIEFNGESYKSLAKCEQHAISFLNMNKEVNEVFITKDIMRISRISQPYKIVSYE